MDPASLDTYLDELKAGQEEIITKLKNSKEKDRWDKFSIVSTFVSGVLLVAVGGVFTYYYQMEKDQQQSARDRQQAQLMSHQGRLQEIQTVGLLMPYITSDNEDIKKVALIVVKELASTELMAAVAKSKPTLASTQALGEVIASPGSSKREQALAAAALDDIFKVRRPAVVKITAIIDGRPLDKSGFFVSRQGHILTAAFTLTNAPGQTKVRATEVKVTTIDQKVYSAQILGMNTEGDVALLKVDAAEDTPYLELAEGVPQVGEPILVIGSTGEEFLTRIAGQVDKVLDNEVSYVRDRPSVPGFGGGPVLDRDGKVVGINWGALDPPAPVGSAKFVKVDRARKYLASLGLLN
jgi:hypothetical protein